jgi:hypothetical protein
MPVLDVKLLYLGRRFLETQAERDNAASGGAGDGVEIVGDRLASCDLLLDQRQDRCGVDTPDAAAIK